MGFFTRQEWMAGFKALDCDSNTKLKSLDLDINSLDLEV